MAGPWQADLRPGMIVGRELAYINGGLLDPGEAVQMLIPDGRGGTIGKLTVEVSDTAGTGVYEVDRTATWLPIPYAQRLTAFDARRNDNHALISGFRLAVTDPEDPMLITQVSQHIERELGLSVQHWRDIRVSLLKNTEIYRNLMTVVMILIQGLCIFISYAVFSTLVAEKRHDIGVLLGLGAKPSAMAQTFLWAGMIASLLGGLAGWGFGWLILSVLNPVTEHYGIQLFPQEFIYTADTPVSFDPLYPLLFVSIAALTGLLAAVIPAWRAAHTQPIASIREAG